MKSCLCLLLSVYLLASSAAAADVNKSRSPEQMPVAELVEHVARARATRLVTIELSPDGRYLYYVIETLSDEHPGASQMPEQSTKQGWLQALGHDGRPIGQAKSVSAEAFWRPGNQLVMSGDSTGEESSGDLIFLDVVTGIASPAPARFAARVHVRDSKSIIEDGVPHIPRGGKWSDSGRYYAFISPRSAPPTTPGSSWDTGLEAWRGVPLERFIPAFDSTGGQLAIWDTRTGEVGTITDLDQTVVAFDWSPDEGKLIVETKVAGDLDIDGRPRTDLSIISRNGEVIRTLTRAGSDESKPSWSPDGSAIAFLLYDGPESSDPLWPTYDPPKIAFLHPDSGRVEVMKSEQNEVYGRVRHELRWSKNSRFVLTYVNFDMKSGFVMIDRRTGSRSIAVSPSARGDEVYSHTSWLQGKPPSLSADGRLMAFDESTPVQPGELFVTTLDERGRPTGRAHQITHLHDSFALRGAVRIEKLSWQSPDGKFTIHGQLLTPSAAWSGSKLTASLPAVLGYIGGPSYIQSSFGLHWGEMFAMAARGYAVLIPNTRGRAGYDLKLEYGIRDGKSRYGLPHQDAMAGIELLIEKGVIDPERMGVMGHSYGGGLALYTITQTNSFKAAISNDSSWNNLTTGTWPGSKPWTRILARNLFGIHDPYDSQERLNMLRESPALNANKVKTPSLFLYAHGSSGRELPAWQMYDQMVALGIPAAFIYYQMIHAPVGVKQNIDYTTRMIEWMDYWVRGMPWIYPEREAEYVNARLGSSESREPRSRRTSRRDVH